MLSSEDFLAAARKAKAELDSLEGLDREMAKQKIIADLRKILSEPQERGQEQEGGSSN